MCSSVPLASCEIKFSLSSAQKLLITFILCLVSDTIDNYVQKGLYISCIILINVNVTLHYLSLYNYNYYY